MREGTSVWSQPLADFRTATAARKPTPGCGAAAAVTAEIGLALVVKALRISEGHATAPARRTLLHAAEALLGRPGAFADDDMRAFSEYLSASRDGDPEDEQAAARQSCAVPLALAHCCMQALELSVSAWPYAAANLQSDIQAGAVLIHAGLSAALINVDADMASLDDVQGREQAGLSRQRLQAEGDGLLRQLLDQVESNRCGPV